MADTPARAARATHFAIAPKRFDGLRRLIPAEKHDALDGAFLNPADREALVRYRRWVGNGLRAFNDLPPVGDPPAYHVWTQEGLRRIDEPTLVWFESVERSPEKLARGRWTEVFGEPLDDDPAYDPYVSRWQSWRAFDGSRLLMRLQSIPKVVEALSEFCDEMVERGHLDDADRDSLWSVYEQSRPAHMLGEGRVSDLKWARGLRVFLAWQRVLEPLLCARDTGCVERMWEELPDRDLTEFVKAGLQRESILLKRDTDATRARTMRRAVPGDLQLAWPLWDATDFRFELVDEAPAEEED